MDAHAYHRLQLGIGAPQEARDDEPRKRNLHRGVAAVRQPVAPRLKVIGGQSSPAAERLAEDYHGANLTRDWLARKPDSTPEGIAWLLAHRVTP